MKNVIQILSIVLIIVLLIILIVRKYESFSNIDSGSFLLLKDINNLGEKIIQPYKCDFIKDVVVPNKIINNKLRRYNNDISNGLITLLNDGSLNPLANQI